MVMTHPDDDPDKFERGNVVRVKNVPGPRMIVVYIKNTDEGVRIGCMWFNRCNELQTAQFRPDYLAKASPWQYEKVPAVTEPEADVTTTEETDEDE